MSSSRALRFLVVPVLLMQPALGGCARVQNEIELVDFGARGRREVTRLSFDDAFYSIDDMGQLNLIMQRRPSNEADPREHTVHVRTVWRSLPGKTTAHPRQINGTISYCVWIGTQGVCYEGAGSVFFSERSGGDELSGRIDLVRLRPTRRSAAADIPFAAAELSGTFRATNDRRTAVRLVNDLKRQSCRMQAVPPK